MNTPDSLDTPEATNARLALLDKIAATAIADLTASDLGTTITNPAANASTADRSTGDPDQRSAPGTIPARIDTPDPDSDDTSASIESIDPPQQRRGKGRLWALAAAIVLLIAGAIVAYAVTQTHKPQHITTDPTKPSTPPFVLPDGPVQGLGSLTRQPFTPIDLSGYEIDGLTILVSRVDDVLGIKITDGDHQLANGASARLERRAPGLTEVAWSNRSGGSVLIDAFGDTAVTANAAARLPLDGDPATIQAMNGVSTIDSGTSLAAMMLGMLNGSISPRSVGAPAQILTLGPTGAGADQDASSDDEVTVIMISASDAATAVRDAIELTSTDDAHETAVSTYSGVRTGWLQISESKGESREVSAGSAPTTRSFSVPSALLGYPIADDLVVIIMTRHQPVAGETADTSRNGAEALARAVATSLRPVTEAEFLAGSKGPTGG